MVNVPVGAASGDVIVTVDDNSTWSWGIFGIPMFTVYSAAALPNGYALRRAITIHSNLVPNTDQSNFPILFTGTYADLAGLIYNGYDSLTPMATTSFSPRMPAGNTVLPFEQETYDQIHGTVTYWVKVPTVSHTSDTTIYMFYENSAVTTDQSNSTGTWDSNFKAVWHLPNGGTLSANDSTSNSNTSTITSTTAIASPIGGAAWFNGSTSRIDVSGAANTSMSTYTVETWLNPEQTLNLFVVEKVLF